MRLRRTVKRALVFSVVSGVLLFILLHWWGSGDQSSVDIGKERRAAMEQLLKTLAEKTYNESVTSYPNISYHIKDSVASQLAQETCECRGEDEGPGLLPFSDLLFPRVWAHNLQRAYLGNHKDPEGVKSRQAREYEHFKRRAYTSSDLLVVAEANSPLQYPTQGVEVRPLQTIVIPGLALKESPGSGHAVKLTAALGVFDVAATVDGVTITGAGEKSMEMSSAALSSLNRQLQFVTYTNTQFHPRTADTVTFATGGHRAVFTIKVGHAVIPKLFNAAAGSSGGEYDISSLVTIATKTFLRYDKLRDLIASVRRYYPTVTIVVADDNERPQPVTGPHIEHYTMPFGKGWFAGRNLAVSQVTTKYVLWVDDDFIFTAETKLEKMVDVLERTTLDLVAGAVREASGYAATYRHVISTEEGGAEGDCLRIRRGHHHAVDGFPGCVVTDATINFFMARTDKVREPGFDPRLARSGHLEFFVDALGSLHVGSCDDVVVGHASKIRLPWSKMTSDEEAYERFRYSGAGADRGKADEAGFYIKNRFQCMSSQS